MYTFRQKTQADCDADAARVQAEIDARVPGLFKVQPNASAPRVECKGVGGVYCGWSTCSPSVPVEEAWNHFIWTH